MCVCVFENPQTVHQCMLAFTFKAFSTNYFFKILFSLFLLFNMIKMYLNCGHINRDIADVYHSFINECGSIINSRAGLVEKAPQ